MNLKTWCCLFRGVFLACLIAYPIYIILSWTIYPLALQTHSTLFLNQTNSFVNLTVFQRMCAIGIDFSYGIFWMLCLWYLSALFKAYQNEQYFEEKNIVLIKQIGFLFLIEELIRLGKTPLHALLLTYQNPSYKHLITFSFSQDNFYSIVIASTVLLIGAIMRKAQLLQAEQALTI